jgi:hypothetical protein
VGALSSHKGTASPLLLPALTLKKNNRTLPAKRLSVFLVIFKINTDYFLIQHKPTGILNGKAN